MVLNLNEDSFGVITFVGNQWGLVPHIRVRVADQIAAFKANLKVRLIERLNNAYYVLNIRNPADYFFPGGRYGVYYCVFTVFM